jgi:hypothetical protein
MEDKSQERPKRPTTTKLSALYRKCNNAPGQIEDNKRPALGAFAATIVSYVFFATAQSTAMGLLLTTVPFTVLIACNNHKLSSPAQTWYSQLNAYIHPGLRECSQFHVQIEMILTTNLMPLYLLIPGSTGLNLATQLWKSQTPNC